MASVAIRCSDGHGGDTLERAVNFAAPTYFVSTAFASAPSLTLDSTPGFQ